MLSDNYEGPYLLCRSARAAAVAVLARRHFLKPNPRRLYVVAINVAKQCFDVCDSPCKSQLCLADVIAVAQRQQCGFNVAAYVVRKHIKLALGELRRAPGALCVAAHFLRVRILITSATSFFTVSGLLAAICIAPVLPPVLRWFGCFFYNT